jgi:hypothetical protein
MPEPTKSNEKPIQKTQAERFAETARELECDESEEAFDAKFRKLVPAKREGDIAPARPGQKRSVKAKKPR